MSDKPVIPRLGEIRTLPSWESLRGGGYEVPLDEALNIIDQFKAKVAELEAENRHVHACAVQWHQIWLLYGGQDYSQEAWLAEYKRVFDQTAKVAKLEHEIELRIEQDAALNYDKEKFKAKVAEQAATIERLRDAVAKYGRHDEYCHGWPSYQSERCSCGFAKLQEALNPQPSQPEYTSESMVQPKEKP